MNKIHEEITILHEKIFKQTKIIRIKVNIKHKPWIFIIKQIQNKTLKEHKIANNIGKDKLEHSNKIQAIQKLFSVPNQNKFIIKYRIQHGALKKDVK